MTIGFDRGGNPWLIGGGWVPRSVRLVDGQWQDVTVGDAWLPTGGMVLDPEGTVWLSLRRGESEGAIGAFDGRDWRVVELDEPESYLSPNAIAALPDGSLMVGGSRGLAKYDGRGWHWLIRTSYVDSVAMGLDGSVWASGSVGLVRLALMP